MVAKRLEVVDAAGRPETGVVRRAHVGGEVAEHVPEGHLVLDHLIEALGAGDVVQILVAPGVTGDLVALVTHAQQDVRPGGALIVDPPLVEVDGRDEECGWHAIVVQDVQQLGRVDVRAVVVRDCDGTWLAALGDTAAAPQHAAKFGSRDRGCVLPGRHGIRIAGRPIFKLAGRSVAEVAAGAAKALQRTLISRRLSFGYIETDSSRTAEVGATGGISGGRPAAVARVLATIEPEVDWWRSSGKVFRCEREPCT